jgi:hypothetical protein
MAVAAPYYLNPADLSREVLLPKTLPPRKASDFAPYHWVRNDKGRLSLRRGATPAHVKAAGAAFADGRLTLDQYLDAIGVPDA